jgi:hypothetical protein
MKNPFDSSVAENTTARGIPVFDRKYIISCIRILFPEDRFPIMTALKLF